MTPIIHDMECLQCGYRFITQMPSPCPNCSHKYLIDWGFKKEDDWLVKLNVSFWTINYILLIYLLNRLNRNRFNNN